jgi:hypothetical protein
MKRLTKNFFEEAFENEINNFDIHK